MVRVHYTVRPLRVLTVPRVRRVLTVLRGLRVLRLIRAFRVLRVLKVPRVLRVLQGFGRRSMFLLPHSFRFSGCCPAFNQAKQVHKRSSRMCSEICGCCPTLI